MSTTGGSEQAGAAPTEEELRAAYEAEIKKIRVEDVLLEHVVTLVNLGMRRTGLQPGTEKERDVEQVRVGDRRHPGTHTTARADCPGADWTDPRCPIPASVGVRQDRRLSTCGGCRRRGQA